MSESTRTVSRDVTATMVPYGDEVVIPEGSKVIITHQLGGNFTVTWEQGMARISGENADAIGEEKVDLKVADSDHEGPPDEDKIWEALRTVYDPEIPVNIVDLGLVYSMDVKGDDKSGFQVEVQMTLTAPGCGMGPAIAEDAKRRVITVPGVSDSVVDIVWDPPWNQEMISEQGKMELGLI